MRQAIPTAKGEKAGQARTRASKPADLVGQKSKKGRVELSEAELDRVSGGITLSFTKVEYKYVEQKPT
jgi:hypothetical protein